MPVFDTRTPLQTKALGEALAKQLRAGDVVLLEGDLGAGKSELARGIARGLGVSGHVPSPSFTIMQVYEDGRLQLYHFDWYRIASADELYEIAAEEYLYGEGVSLVEWPGVAQELIPQTHLLISITVTGDTGRRLSLAPAGGFHTLDYQALEASI